MATKKQAWVYCENDGEQWAGIIAGALKSWNIDTIVVSDEKGFGMITDPDFIVISLPRQPASLIIQLVQSLPRKELTRIIVVSDDTLLSASSAENGFEVLRAPNDSHWFEELRDMLGV